MIPAIVLAAGKSTRMGRPKANLRIGQETFLTRIVRTLHDADVDDVVVVVGHDRESIARSFGASARSARLVENSDYESGQLSSILAGLQVVDRPGVVAVLVTLVDVPLVSASTVRAVVDCFKRTRAPIVRPTRGTEHGHPLLIARSLFDALRRADPLQGAKPLVRAHATRDGDLEIDDAGAFADIDTPDDYDRTITVFAGDRRRSPEEDS